MKKKYKKIKEGVFEVIEEGERVVGTIKLEDIENTKDYYEKKFNEMDLLLKELNKVK